MTAGPQVHDARLRTQAKITISWHSYPNDDIGESNPDEGWYVDVEVGDCSYTIGPDFYGPGIPSLDEALRLVEKWASQRGLTVDKPVIQFYAVQP